MTIKYHNSFHVNDPLPEPVPATKFFVTLKDDRVWIEYDGTHGGKISRTVKDVDDFNNFLISKADEAGVKLEDLRVLMSSSLDFPHEYTESVATLTLARALRS